MGKNELRTLRNLISHLRSVNPEFPAQQIALLLEIAEEGETNSATLCEKLGLNQASLSRNTRALSLYADRDPQTGNMVKKGLDLITTHQDMVERRRFVYKLTEKGRKFVDALETMIEKTAEA